MERLPDVTQQVQDLRQALANLTSQPNIVFLTNGTFSGNLGGLSGADAICQAAADAATLPPGS